MSVMRPTLKSTSSRVFTAALLLCFSGCANLPGSGPSAATVKSAEPAAQLPGIRVVDLDATLVRRVLAVQRQATLAEAFGARGVTPSTPARFVIGLGDTIEVSVWEAPPAALFGITTSDPRNINSSSRVAALPEQMVSASGEVNIPFAGAVKVVGRTSSEVEQDIANRLRSKANDPQVLVRVLRNSSNMVTVVGEVTTSTRFPLTPTGERLLDALAASGGFRQPVGKITIRVTRDDMADRRRTAQVVSLPLETIITDPAQNIVLHAGDVITALYQSNSFTALGATGRNEEINFEASGITLAQALGRSGGLRDERANAAGIFIFRFEDVAIAGESTPHRINPDGKVPVVYRVDLKDPASFFLAQDFPMRNRDVIYIANAPAAELQKFLNMVSSVIFPLATTRSIVNP